MALVRNITKRVDIPGEDGEYGIVRKLTWKQLEAAREARSDVGARKMRDLGGDIVKTFHELQERAKKDAADAKASPTKRDRTRDYDIATVLKFGVSRLSYTGEDYKAEDVDELDEPTARFFFDEILNFSGVAETEAQAEAEAKNG